MAVGVDIVSNFDGKGLSKAIKEFKKLDGASAKSAFALGTLDKSATAAVKGLAKVAAGVAIAAGVIGAKLAGAAYESQKVMAQTEAIITSTGGAAGVTASEVQKLSDALAMQIGVDDELIQSSANLLLTFKAVANQAGAGNDIFNQAVIAAQDLGNVFGSAEGAAVQLGKALTDPIAGITALKKAGITFTDQQKAQIKTLVESGNSLAAQKVILAEVQAQVGGTAAATATGFDRMKVAMGNVAENLGALLIPYIERFANFLVQTVVPYLNKLVDVLGDKGVGGVVRTLSTDFLNMTSNMGPTGNLIMGIVTAFVALKAAMLAYTIAQGIATIAVAVFGVAWNATGIGLIAALIAAVVIGLIALYIRFESVRKVVGLVGDVLKFVVANAITLVYNYFASFVNLAIKGINLLIKGANLFGAGLDLLPEIALKAFTAIEIGANKATTAVGRTAKAINAEASRYQGLANSYKNTPTPTPTPTGTGVGAAVKTLIELMKDYKDAVIDATEAGVKFAEAGQAIKDAQQKVVDATLGVQDAFRGIAKAQQEVINKTREHTKATNDVRKAMADAADAVIATQKAQQSLAGATGKVVEAQLALDKAVNGYGANSKQGKTANEKLEESQQKLVEGGYSLEQRQYKVIDAEAELVAVRADATSTARQIREAEIEVATAKLDLIDAQREQSRTQQQVTDDLDTYNQAVNGVSTDSEIYQGLLDKLNEAKKTERDAIDAVAEARQSEAEAVLAIGEALLQEQEALVAVEDAKLAVSKAIRDHEKALYDEAAAIRDVAKATLDEAKALDAVAEAQRKVNEAKRVSGLTPAAIRKVDTKVAGVLSAASAVVAQMGTAAATKATAGTAGVSGDALAAFMERNAMAKGGVAMRPTLRLIGEAGPEAVVPLSRISNDSGTTISVVVNAGLGANPGAVGDAVVDALIKYQRRNGAIPITVKG